MNPTPLNVTRRPKAGPMRWHIQVNSCNGCPALTTLTLNGVEEFVCEYMHKRPIVSRVGDYLITPDWCPGEIS